MIKYFEIKNYSMKCRLYPNKEQAEYIDNCLQAMRVLNNMINYDMRNSFMYTTESKDKNTGETIHWAKFKEAFNKDALNYYREKNPIIRYVPANALSDPLCGLRYDFTKSANTPHKSPVEKWGETYINENDEVIHLGAKFYSKNNPPKSYCYQTDFKHLCIFKNENVLGVHLNSRWHSANGFVRIRGWNKGLRFDEDYTVDFRELIRINQNTEKIIRIRICKDNCGDYYIVFTLPKVYKPVNVPEQRIDCRGIDVGEITLATVSTEGKKYKNLNDHYNGLIKKEYETLEYYDKKMSKMEGWRNQDFKDRHKKDKSLKPSRGYEKYSLKDSRLHRKISRQKQHYYDNVSKEIVTSVSVLGIEGLCVKDMQFKKDKPQKEKKKKNGSKRQNKSANKKA